jgi:CheY-like chemotaxis protein
MTPEVLKRIFDPFFTTKEIGAGTGLGLAISHGIVTSLGGDLRAESVSGTGSKFDIVLPPAPGASAAVSAPATESFPIEASRPGRILVIDDEEVLLRAIATILELDGHTVVTTTHARDALAKIVNGEEFDVILSDMAMPNMTGMEFWDALQAHDPRLAQRVMFLSGGAVTDKAEDFLKRVGRKYIGKPFKSEVLRRAVREALEEARGGASSG